MEQKELTLDDLFLGLQSLFNQATLEEKQRLVAQFSSWSDQQKNSLSILTSTKDPGWQEYPTLLKSSLVNRSGTFLKDIQSLIKGESHLIQIVENIKQVFWLSDIHSEKILYVSPAFETIWGQSCESLYTNPQLLIESVHPEDRVQVMVARSHKDYKPFNQAYRIIQPDGSHRWIFARTFLIHDENAESDYLFCIAEDITDQKQVELALQKTLDRTHVQINLSRKMSLARKPEAVLKTLMSAYELRSARRATLLFFDNPKIGPTFGMEMIATWLSSQNLPPWPSETNLYEEPALWELLQPNRTVVITGTQSDPRLKPMVRDFLLEGQIQSLVIFPLITLEGWLGCLMVYYEQEHPLDRNKLRHIKVLVDQATITLYNLRLLEEEEESRHEAERANEIKTEFLAMISHELRTPLTSIIGFTTTLLAEDVVWESNEQHDFIQTIEREANRLQELIDHLLDLSRLEAGMLPISQEAHSLHEIIKDALPQFHTLTCGQILSLHIPSKLPPIYGDAKRIAQILVNLVRNASTYAPKGTEIIISASVRGSFVQVNVNDQGPGIPKAEHKRVFKAFWRGPNVENDSTQGAGLGLAICKGLVEAHGGRIWIMKKNTPGATISFTIPLVPAHAPETLAEEER